MDILSQQITIILIASVFLLLVAVGVVSLILVYQKRQLQFVHDKKELQNNFQRELLKTKIEAQEETLAHVGCELHDNIGQLPSSTKLLVASAGNSAGGIETLAVANQTLSDAIGQVRALSKSLTTDWLEKFDLLTHLRQEVSRLCTHNLLNIQLQLPDELALSGEQQIMIFRMAQECLQNAIKHGKATELCIKLWIESPLLYLSVTDNGEGFKIPQTASGMGMTNIKTRAKLLGGDALWESGPNGTTVNLHIPYDNAFK
ncbi:MAG: sensor histidine kinase [Cytophagales bacterium]